MHAVQMLRPVVLVIVPESHADAAVAPEAHAEPAGHVVQSDGPVAAMALRYDPAAHSRAALAPSSQYEPAGQSMHAVEPSADWYLPAAHFSQESSPGWSLYVPRAQSVSLADPTGQNVPTAQVTQSASLVIGRVSDEFLRVPPGHGNGAAEPSAQ